MTVMLAAASAYAQTTTISGTVVSASDNEPLIGASVSIANGAGVATNLDGNFTLNVAEGTQATVSYVGYQTQTVRLTNGIVIALQDESNVLGEVVVTGYGSAKKPGSIVGAVSVVSSDVLENTPSTTFVDALQGKVAGLSIWSNSGDPSSTDNEVLIRGTNSLYASTTPLYILDGAPVSQTVFTTLNPADIENITVLKDAASTALYGSRASNGVIVITSKKGKMGEKAQVTVRANLGWGNKLPDKVTMMNSQQLLDFGDLVGQPFPDEIKQYVADYGISTNWTDQMFRTATTYSLEGVVRGGSDKSSYYLSLGHYDQEGIINQSGMRRETLRWSMETQAAKWLRIGFQGNLGYTKYQTNGMSDDIYNGNIPEGPSIYTPSLFQYFARPWDSPYYVTFDEAGNIHYGDKAQYLHYSGAVTPDYITDNQKLDRNRITVNANIFEQITPIRGLILRAQQSVDAYDSRLIYASIPRLVHLTPMGDKLPSTNLPLGSYTSGSSQNSFSRYYQFTYTNTAEYDFSFGKNNLNELTILLGQESIIQKSNAFGALSTGHTDPRLLSMSQGSTVTISDLSQSSSRIVMNSYFANVNYNYAEKYFVDAAIRRDGSSKFAPGHRWGTFFSVGARWNMKNESWLKRVQAIDQLSIRANYGQVGNSGIPNYLYFGAFGTTAAYGPGNTVGSGVADPGNNMLTWETTSSFDFGVSGRVFQHLSFDIDVYKKTTFDMLMSIPWSYTQGFSSGYGNVGKMTNTGVEIDLNADIYSDKNWYVGANFNIGYNKNEITELFDGLDAYTIPNTGTRFEIGKSSTDYYYVKFAGVDPRDGKQMWYTPAGNLSKVYNEETMAQFLGKNYIAPWNGGFGVNARWKGLALRADFNYSLEKYLMNNDKRYVQGVDLFLQGLNQSVEMLNIWTHPGQITDIPAATEDIEFDSRFIENASFMRLKNLTVSYTLPRNILDKLYLKDLTFHFTGRNLFTVTKYSGLDPEPAVNRVLFFYPNTRQFEFGLEVSF